MNEYQPFYRITAEAGDDPSSAELLIFDAIGNWDELGEVSAKAFARDLAKLPTSVKRLDIHINSPGGSVSEANGIYSRLADHRSEKIVYIDGLAASAATIVAMVGHKIYIRAHATMMIHLPGALAMGNADDMRAVAAALDSHTEAMINVYAKRTKQPRDEIRELMRAETWFSPQQAVEKGFADEMRGVVKAAAAVGDKRVIFNGLVTGPREFDLSQFHNVPAFSANTIETKPMAKTKVKAATENDEEENEEQETPTPPKETPTPPPEKPAPPTPGPRTEPTPSAAVSEYDKGVTAERDRVLALQKIDGPLTHDIVSAAIKDGRQVTDIVNEITDALAKQANQRSRRVDASVLDTIPPADGADSENNFGALLKTKVKSRLKARGQRSAFNGRN
jgi:ATP-dependent protease ClpP protease subunit